MLPLRRLLPRITARSTSSRPKDTPVSRESTRSGTDDEIAHNPAAYDPRETDPVAEKAAVGRAVRPGLGGFWL